MDQRRQTAVYEPREVVTLSDEQMRQVGEEARARRAELSHRLERLDRVRRSDFEIRTR